MSTTHNLTAKKPRKKKNLRIEVKRSKSGEWYFHIISKNGLILAHSETYERKLGAIKGAQSLVKSITDTFAQENGFIPSDLIPTTTYRQLIHLIDNA